MTTATTATPTTCLRLYCTFYNNPFTSAETLGDGEPAVLVSVRLHPDASIRDLIKLLLEKKRMHEQSLGKPSRSNQCDHYRLYIQSNESICEILQMEIALDVLSHFSNVLLFPDPANESSTNEERNGSAEVATAEDLFSLQSVERMLNICLRDQFSEDEWREREKLAAAYRWFDLFGWTDTIYGHLTAKVPGEDAFLINAFGLDYSEITASSLVKVSLDGTILHPGNTPFGINRAGYVIHSAIHEAREDVKCVMHCHQNEGTAIACLRDGLLPLTQTSFVVGAGINIAYHDFEGIAVDADEKKRLAADLGNHNILLLKNHGLVTCGATIGAAFMMMINLVNACKMQAYAMAAAAYSNNNNSGSGLIVPPKQLAVKSFNISNNFNPEGQGRKELAAYMRKLDVMVRRGQALEYRR